MNSDIALNLLSFASGGLATLLNIGLIVIGLVHARRVNALAGMCFAAAGAIGALSSLIRRFAGIVASISGSSAIYTVSQIFGSLLMIVSAVLLPFGIFLLANAVKQATNPQR